MNTLEKKQWDPAAVTLAAEQYNSPLCHFGQNTNLGDLRECCGYPTMMLLMVQAMSRYYEPYVLDMGCGIGDWTMVIRGLGAGRVTGIDISSKNLEIARQISHDIPRLSFLEGNAADPEMFKKHGLNNVHDIVTAFFLWQYASSREMLYAFCVNSWNALHPGGMIVGAVPNEYLLGTRYGLTRSGGDASPFAPIKVQMADFESRPLAEFTNYHIERRAYQQTLEDIGFRHIRWYPVTIAPEALARYGGEFWQDALLNPPAFFFVAERTRK